MGKRIGKYKITNRESTISLVDGGNVAGPLKSNYLRFITGTDYKGLTLVSKTDANADSGFTMTANAYHEVSTTADATQAIVLPAADVDTLCVFEITAQADGGDTSTFSTTGTDTYEAQSLNILNMNIGDAAVGRYSTSTDFTPGDNLGKIVTLLATDNRISISSTATNNQTNAGAKLAFYCETAGKWRVAFQGSELGNGTPNATFSGSAH